jgi:hypothetical protein
MTDFESESAENDSANPPSLARSKKSSGGKNGKYAKPVPAKIDIDWLTFEEIIDCPESVSERIDYIADTMSALRWQRGKTGKLIAKKWCLSQSTIDGYASEASRAISNPRDEAKATLVTGAEKLFIAAIKNGSAKDAKMMGDLLAAVTGANAPQKQEIAAVVGAATPKTAREIMASVFKGDVGKGVSEEIETPNDTEPNEEE